eukprot:CAMPEP_0196160050 /NCGR_PEP_ID=MMETSP0910-20130528/46629_1 /TAXON_ID=49265 /ORGANISM="Thalassiosira rotula, Strain GSO102" /LENGTH=706 /DNA_ID=CAMNT_0041424975 /DNA_START=53 /DNA_END=2173 /DNA_ORIENTATION=-
MTIRGVEMINDVPAWETATTKHIMGNLPPGYSDVEISIELKKQVSSNEALNELFKRRLLSEWLPWLDHWHTQSPGQYYLRGGANNSQQQRQRRLQGKVEVGYEQTSTWQTDDPNKDEINLILNAFSTRQTTTRYVKVVKSLGYSSVTSVGSITIDPIPEGTPIDDAILGIVRIPEKSWFKKIFGGDMEEKTETSIVVAVCAMFVLFAGFAAVAIRRRRNNRRMKEIHDDSFDGSSSSSNAGGRRKSKKSSRRAKDKDTGRTEETKKGITKMKVSSIRFKRRKSKKSSRRAKDKDTARTQHTKKGITEMKVSSIRFKKSEKKGTKKDRSLSPGDLEDRSSSSDEEGRGRSKGSSSDDNKKKRRSRSTREKRDSSEDSSKDDKKGRRSRSTRKKRDSSEESSSDEDEKRGRRSRGTRNRSVSSEESSSDEDGRRGRRSRSALKRSKSARRAKSKRRGRSISFSSDDSDSQIFSIDEGGRYKSRRKSQGRRSSLHAFRDTHQSKNKYHSQASTMEETPFGSSEGNIYRSRSSGVDVDLMMDNLPESPPSLVMATSPKSKTSSILFHIFAPPGKLGVIMDTPLEGGNAYICHIKESCPIIDNIHLNDKVLMVDDEDVQMMNAADVSRLLARKSRQAHRKISVLREVVKREPVSSMCDSDAFVDELDRMGLPIENGILIPLDHEMMVPVEDSRPYDYGMMVPVDESRLAEF